MTTKLKQNEEIAINQINKIADKIHFVNAEKHGNVEYWFDAHDGQFIAQGKTESEIIDHCRGRFPQHSFFIVGADAATVFRIGAPDWQPQKTDIDLTKNRK